MRPFPRPLPTRNRPWTSSCNTDCKRQITHRTCESKMLILNHRSSNVYAHPKIKKGTGNLLALKTPQIGRIAGLAVELTKQMLRIETRKKLLYLDQSFFSAASKEQRHDWVDDVIATITELL